MADVSILQPAVAAAPNGYKIAGALEVVLRSVSASFDGTGAGGSFIPALQIIDPTGVVTATYPASTTLSAGGTADVSWFPIGVQTAAATPGGGATEVLVPLTTPDATGFAVPSLTTANGFSRTRLIAPYFLASQTSTFFGAVTVPNNYTSTPALVLSWTVNSTTGNVRWIVSTAVVAAGATLDPAYTAETAQTVAAPGTALFRKDTTFSLSTTPAIGSTLLVQVERNGSNAADTCPVSATVLQAMFTYS